MNEMRNPEAQDPGTDTAGEASEAELRRILDAINNETGRYASHRPYPKAPSTSAAYGALKTGPMAQKVGIVRLIWREHPYGDPVFSALMRTRLDLPPEEVLGWIRSLRDQTVAEQNKKYTHHLPPFIRWQVGLMVKQVERIAKSEGLSRPALEMISDMVSWPEFNSQWTYGSDLQKAKSNLKDILASARGDRPSDRPSLVLRGDDFGAPLERELLELAPEDADRRYRVLELAAKADAGRPSASFDRKTGELEGLIGRERLRKELQYILERAVAARVSEVRSWPPMFYLTASNVALLKGIVWMCRRFEDRRTIHLVADLCEKCMKKLPGSGIASQSVANACLLYLEDTPGADVAARLSRLSILLRQKTVRDRVRAAIGAKAAKVGLSPAQLEERVVPDHGLSAGEKTVPFDGHALRIVVEGPGCIVQTWTKPDGAPLKSKPKHVGEKPALKARYATLQAEVATLKKITTAQRDRIDRLFAEDMSWPIPDLMEFYIEHPIVGVIASRLIWQFGEGPSAASAMRCDGRWEDATGREVAIDDGSRARLWHPVDRPEAEVMAWRRRILDTGIVQPMKQAYREIYLLTDAERATGTYSNRMAAHILKQHQMASLMGTRGWTYRLTGAFDDNMDTQFATRDFSTSPLRAEYLIHKKWPDDDRFCNDMGMLLYAGTDQLRFTAGGEPVELAGVPVRLLSEAMRDADLFVGVASVANDAEWHDQGPTPAARDYWRAQAFGELDGVSETRRAVLEALLPRLAIRDRARIDGRWLVVTGRRHVYKIHLGSSNILIAPADRYLCIVLKAVPSASRVALPFEGDQRLSEILSKAVMLARDDEITDPVILAQL